MTLKVNLAINFAFLKASNIHLGLKLLKYLLVTSFLSNVLYEYFMTDCMLFWEKNCVHVEEFWQKK